METVINDIRPARTKRARWRQYERQKALLQQRGLSPEAYQLAIQILVKKLRL